MTALGSRPAPETQSGRRPVRRGRAASMHAEHAVRRNRTRSAAGTLSGHRQHSRRHRRPKVSACPSTSRSSSERLGQTHFWSPMPPAVLAVTAEGASCAARAVPSDSVFRMLAARPRLAGRLPDGVSGAGREPSAVTFACGHICVRSRLRADMFPKTHDDPTPPRPPPGSFVRSCHPL